MLMVAVEGIEIRSPPTGDKVFIASYVQMDDNEAHTDQPRVRFVDAQNRLR